jgi:hypothetical protein
MFSWIMTAPSGKLRCRPVLTQVSHVPLIPRLLVLAARDRRDGLDFRAA